MTITYHSGGRLQGIETDRTTKSLGVGDVGGWVEVGRTTLDSAGDSIDVTSLPNKRYYMTLASGLGSSNPNMDIQLNSDTQTNYSYRSIHNGGSDSANVGQPSMAVANNGAVATINIFGVSYFANIQAEEKLVYTSSVQQNSAGAGNAPARTEVASKWANTSNSISSINHVNLDSGHDFASGSEVVVLGWDPADTHTTNFWEELDSKTVSSGKSLYTNVFTPKKYLWVQAWGKFGSANGAPTIQVGNTTIDTGSYYASRFSSNGVANTAAPNGSNIDIATAFIGAGGTFFLNIFIVNDASKEKLMIWETSFSSSETAPPSGGSGTAPVRREGVSKWVNTSDQINIIRIWNNSSGDYSDGQITVWGSD